MFAIARPLDAQFRAFPCRLVIPVPDTAATATLIMESKSNPRVAAARKFLLFPVSEGPGGIPEHYGMTRLSSYLCFFQLGPRFLTLLAVPAARLHKLIHDRCLVCLIFILHPPILTIIRDSSSLVLPPGFTAAVTEVSTPHGTRFLASTRWHYFPPHRAYRPRSPVSAARQLTLDVTCISASQLSSTDAHQRNGEYVCGEIAALLRFFDVDQVMAHFDPGRRNGEQNGKMWGRRRSVLNNN
ncbi:hypothetical protein DFH08DRAFT_865937 [Mycena albidolilacea]|uniref:Uncharacterized protein n=1 Tax=Mycena albidolilacea TaxID=1033008 RepID=A0AAD7ERS3_9AGAR|nr:hypothetical protein DFH08DRAFT_865937 [Mycena albidolilacea]